MDNLCNVSKETAYQLGYTKGHSDAVRHGKWIWDDEDECWVCSNCEMSALNNWRGDSLDSEYCPHCGAIMDGVVL